MVTFHIYPLYFHRRDLPENSTDSLNSPITRQNTIERIIQIILLPLPIIPS
jgi:hypothetical protein